MDEIFSAIWRFCVLNKNLDLYTEVGEEYDSEKFAIIDVPRVIHVEKKQVHFCTVTSLLIVNTWFDELQRHLRWKNQLGHKLCTYPMVDLYI